MSSSARNHHYLPQSYLAGFTDTGSKGGRLLALDVKDGHSFFTSPRNVAAERDFNRVNIPSKSPHVVERALSGPEGVFSTSLRNIRGTSSFPNDEDRNALMNLMALVVGNSPRTRAAVHKVHEQLFQKYSAAILSDKSLFASTSERNNRKSRNEHNSPTYEELSREIEPGKLRLKPSTHNSVVFAVDIIDDLLKVFDKRYWTLFSVPKDGPEFICSDHPASLWSRRESRLWEHGHGVRDTEIFFPLNTRQGIFGIFEKILPSDLTLSTQGVSDLNARTYENAKRQVYSAQTTFVRTVNGEYRKTECAPINK